jgi:transcriptional regulator with XRE-family HTH domain
VAGPHSSNVDWFYRGFGERLRAARGKRLTQEELGQRVGLSRTSIANLEAGRQRVPLHMLYVFARELGVPAASLLPDRRDMATAVRADLMAPYGPEDRRVFETVVGRARSEPEGG